MEHHEIDAISFAKGISEIVLVVADVPASVEFYREILGLELELVPSESWAWFRMGEPGAPQRLALRRGPLGFEEHSPRPREERWGAVHFALRVPREELEAAVSHIRSCGVEVYGPSRLAWMAAVGYYVFDPDGNLVELWSPDP